MYLEVPASLACSQLPILSDTVLPSWMEKRILSVVIFRLECQMSARSAIHIASSDLDEIELNPSPHTHRV